MQTKKILTALMMAAVVGVLAGACKVKSGSGGDPVSVDLSVEVTDAPAAGALAGSVVDENGAPIANATVTAGNVTTSTDDSGAFSLAPSPGRAVLTVSAKAKISLTRSIGVTSESPALQLQLATAGAAQKVTPAGGVLTAGAVSLDVPGGAYPSGGSVAATWIDRAHVAAASGRPLFTDEGGLNRFVGQLHIEASSEPATPVTLRVPLPKAAPEVVPVLYELKDGEVGARIEASSRTASEASFSVPHFSDYEVFMSTPIPSLLPSADEITKKSLMILSIAAGRLVDATGRLLKVGDDVPANTRVSGAPFVAWSPNGAQVACGPDPITLNTNEDGSTELRCDVCQIHAEVPKFKTATGVKKFIIRTKTAVFGVRGTVFSVRQKLCSQADGSAIDTVEVSEGDVDFDIGGAHFDVPAGKQARGCDGCADPRQAVCDCDVVACEKAGGGCLVCPGLPPGLVTARVGGIAGCAPLGATCCGAPARAWCAAGETCAGGRCLAYGKGGGVLSAQAVEACYESCGKGCDPKANPMTCGGGPLVFWCEGECRPPRGSAALPIRGPAYCETPYACDAGFIAVCCKGGTFDWLPGDGCAASAACIASCYGKAVCGGGPVSTSPNPPVPAMSLQ